MNQSGLCEFRAAGDQLETLSKVPMELKENCFPVCSFIPPTQINEGTGVRRPGF